MIAAALVLGAALGGTAKLAHGAPTAGARAASPVYVAPEAAPSAADRLDWQARDWAMACMSCHNASAPISAGKAVLPVLEGRPAAELMATLQAMRDARRGATLMPQLLKGYRDDELQRIAAYFAAQPAPSGVGKSSAKANPANPTNPARTAR
ncbi:Cytochrome subunit of sulfide dehydrogenase [Pandoraea morbifera]|uniref:Cytochrome subunit of sulfide dehydrogenase n=2 Tax=Pandoraea morbifera TaxID=2508300 RepID=A0A5E4X618_9BURK|nr:Cytochrome subunit of sulfide dehydrogenase [Pandoraea morbifera]